MKGTLPLLGVVLASLAAPGLRGQLVHLQFTSSPTANYDLLFRATSADIAWNQTPGLLTRLDLYFDLDDAVFQESGDITFTDPSRSFWRAHVEAGEIGSFDIQRPIEGMQLWGTGLYLAHAHYSSPYEAFELSASFVGGDPASPFPAPGSVLDENAFRLEAGRSFFDYPDLLSGYGAGGFASATITVSETPLTPVPEPATFSLAALIVFAGAVALRVRRSRPPAHPAPG